MRNVLVSRAVVGFGLVAMVAMVPAGWIIRRMRRSNK